MFKVKENGSTWGSEILAGITTFLTIAYILFLNPQILAEAGMPTEGMATTIALGSALSAVLIGLFCNRPYVFAPGVGMTAFFTYVVVIGYGVTWQVALAATFVSGMIFFILSLFGLRDFLYLAIPKVVRISTMAGIGFFLAFIGFRNAGLTTSQPGSLLALGDLSSSGVLLALLGLLVMGSMMAWRLRGAIITGIVVVSILAWAMGITPAPQQWFAVPGFSENTLFAMDFTPFATFDFLQIVLVCFFLTSFDFCATISGLERLGGFMEKDGKIFGSKSVYLAQGAGMMLSSGVGTSPNTVFVESAIGTQAGGRTGVTALTIGILFAASIFFMPVLIAIPAFATAPALIIAGAMMMRGVSDLDWSKMEDVIPAFLTITCMTFGFNIAYGLAFGVISFTVLNLLRDRFEAINGSMIILSSILVAFLIVSA